MLPAEKQPQYVNICRKVAIRLNAFAPVLHLPQCL